MTQYSFNVNGQSVIGKPAWNPNGTLHTFQVTQDPFDSSNVQTCTYAYDDVARISSANCGSVWSQNFSFDPFGNITKSGSLSWMPGYDQTTNRYSLGGVTYDNNGNLTYDTLHTYQRDVEGHAVVFDSTNSVFNAFGNLVEQDAPTWNQEFIYDENSRQIGGAVGQGSGSAHLPLPGGAQAVYGTGGALAYYAHVDWLGSERLHSTPSRTVFGDTALAPFGEYYANSNSTDPYHFAGYPLDYALGVFDTPFRQYQTSESRWLTPDPAGLAAVDPTNPQTWNRYAYVLNNPLSANDPLGLWCVWEDGTHDDDEIDGGVGSGDCGSQGGHWDSFDTITGIFQDGNGNVTQINYIGGGFCTTADCGVGGTLAQFDQTLQSYSVSPISPSWAGDFLSSFFGAFTLDFGSGSCLSVAASGFRSGASAAQSAASNVGKYAPLLVAAANPGNASAVSGALYFTANAVQQMGGPPQDVAAYTAAAGAISSVASTLSSIGSRALSLSKAPTFAVVLGAADVALGVGVYQEAKAALNGKCR
jgi:RHS repeat-associated protein